MMQASKLDHADLTERIIGVFFDVYNELGCGFLESVHEEAMSMALVASGLRVERQRPVTVWFRGSRIGDFKADLIVEGCILLARSMDVTYEKQLLNYLRATNLEIGLILNFGPRAEFRRLAFSNYRKQIRVSPRASAAKMVRP